jgi:hypothetical protein
MGSSTSLRWIPRARIRSVLCPRPVPRPPSENANAIRPRTLPYHTQRTYRSKCQRCNSHVAFLWDYCMTSARRPPVPCQNERLMIALGRVTSIVSSISSNVFSATRFSLTEVMPWLCGGVSSPHDSPTSPPKHSRTHLEPGSRHFAVTFCRHLVPTAFVDKEA